MKPTPSLKLISDDALFRKLSGLVSESRRVEAELVAHIAEVDRRRLYARKACSSMHAYCREVLHLSGCEAFLRIAAARASRKHPVILEMLRDGRLHLSGIERLARVLTDANRDALLKRATYKSKREIEKMIVEIVPQPDVATTIRKLPAPRPVSRPAPQGRPEEGVSESPGPDRVPMPQAAPRVEATLNASVPAKPAMVEPLSSARYLVKFTASAELNEKLNRLRSLMRSSVPDGDLAQLIEEAVTEKLERLEARRFGKTSKPRKSLEQTDTAPTSRHIPAAVRRAVYERDSGRCAFVDEDGRRCTSRDRLEFDHQHAYGRGGDHSVANVRISCRRHNQYRADLEYGPEKMQRHRDGVSEPGAVYSAYIDDRAHGRLSDMREPCADVAALEVVGEDQALAPRRLWATRPPRGLGRVRPGLSTAEHSSAGIWTDMPCTPSR